MAGTMTGEPHDTVLMSMDSLLWPRQNVLLLILKIHLLSTGQISNAQRHI